MNISSNNNNNLPLPPLPDLDDFESLSKSHRFGDYSNWLIPGKIMQGRNPTSGRGSAANRINTIVGEGGCRTFVCLQAEACPQDETEAGVIGGVEDWKTAPMKFDSYKEDVIAAVDDAVGNDGASSSSPAFLHYGIRDFDVADSLEGLSVLIDNLAERVRAGEILYSHCWGGKGRAGIVSACLLGEFYAIDAEEALERTEAYANLRVMAGTKINSPETDGQKDQVRAFYEFRRQQQA
jgi:hypothetical protein